MLKIEFIIDSDKTWHNPIGWKIVEQGYVPKVGDHLNLFIADPDGPRGGLCDATVRQVYHGVGAPPRVYMQWNGHDPKRPPSTEKDLKELRKHLKKYGWRQRRSPKK